MSRKDLVEQAIENLTTGNSEQRFLAIRDLKKALEFEDNEDLFPDGRIRLYVILTELSENLKSGKQDIEDYIFDHIRSYHDGSLKNLLAGKNLKVGVNNNAISFKLSEPFKTFLLKMN